MTTRTPVSAASVQDWLPGVGEQPLFTVRSHIAAETTADTDAICATVSRDVFFAVPVRTRTGNEIPPGTVLTSYGEVRDHYSARADSYVVVDSAQLKSFSSDWYVLNESAATLRGTGAVGSADAAGKEFVVNSVILFPTAADGIRGEICVTRHPFEDVVADVAPHLPPEDASFPAREMKHTVELDRFVEALRTGDPSRIGRALSQHHTLALRVDSRAGKPAVHALNGREDAQRALTELFTGSRDIALVARIATDWYVFAEYAAPLEGGGVRRLAAIHPVDKGELTGTFGYGRDEDADDLRDD